MICIKNVVAGIIHLNEMAEQAQGVKHVPSLCAARFQKSNGPF